MLRGLRAFTASLLLFSALPVAVAAAHDGHDADLHPAAWILVDADSGAVLSAHNIHEALPPASIIKVMTALVALEQAPLDSEITVSAEAAGRPARRIAMQEGQVWALEDALASMLIVSANDAAWAVAEGVSGDLDTFARDAQRVGERYGMKDSTFVDPAGLDDGVYSVGDGSLSSAYDLAIAARNFLAVPELAQFPPLETYEFTGPDGVHRLLGQNTLIGTYDGATGLKTGTTDRAGHTFIGTAERDGRTMIAVVMNTADPYGHATRLLDEGFATEPGAEGTGDALPAVAVTTHDTRTAFLDSLGPSFEPLVEAAFAAAALDFEWTPPFAATGVDSSASENGGTGRSAGEGNAEDGFSATWLWLLAVVAGAVLFLLVARRRSVLARRRLRDARRRELADAARRGTIHVVQSAGGEPAGERVRKHPSLRRGGGRRVDVGKPRSGADH